MDTPCRVCCVGTGVIGSSWAAAFAVHGNQVALYDLKPELLYSARERILAIFHQLREAGVLDDQSAAEAMGRLHFTTDLAEAAGDAQWIQENAPDRLELKKSVLSQIEGCCPPNAVVASSTSNLLISKIAEDAARPERCIGGHPYNPPHLIPLVEVTRGPKTGDETVAAAVEFYSSCGKTPVVLQKETIGFISNRLQMALYREAVDLVMRGVCSVEDVDAAVTYGPGLRWAALGPNMIYQLGGGEGGLKGLLTALKEGGDALIADLADWKEQPPEWIDLAQAGVLQEMEHFPAYIGHSNRSIGAFRDQVLIELLKLHQKL